MIRQFPLSTAYRFMCMCAEKKSNHVVLAKRVASVASSLLLDCFWASSKSQRGPLFLILSFLRACSEKEKTTLLLLLLHWGSIAVHTNYHPHFRAGPIILVSHIHSIIQSRLPKSQPEVSTTASRHTEHGSHGITTTARAQ